MSKIIFEINYNINPEKREEYLNTIIDLRRSITESSNNNYSVYENKKNPNNFTEVYICENEEEFDMIEDDQSEETIELTQKLFENFIKDNKVNYTTKYEV
jgi:quinol monooxygenase YgiN